MLDYLNISIASKKKQSKSKASTTENDDFDKGDIDDSVKMYPGGKLND